jgi:serine/threonine protein phosphatase 1
MKKKVKTFVLGDLHGGHKALVQVLKRAKFDYNKDRLISLGDVADGWPDVAECFEELLKIKNLVMVRGNHDNWLLDYLRFEETPTIWTSQGGQNSFDSYQKHPELKEKHKKFLMSTPFYYVDEANNLYVHGGVDPMRPIVKQSPDDLMWDRSLWHMAQTQESIYVPGFNKVFVGHTSIWKKSKIPLTSGNVTFVDTGGGWEGKLSLVGVDSEEVFQSDLLGDLYPEGHG